MGIFHFLLLISDLIHFDYVMMNVTEDVINAQKSNYILNIDIITITQYKRLNKYQINNLTFRVKQQFYSMYLCRINFNLKIDAV